MSKISVPTTEAMERMGKKLASLIDMNMKIYLTGPLGAGKTTLVRGFLRAMDYEGIVKSPTYTLVETYDSLKGKIYHFDLYRLHDPEELEFMGMRDYFQSDSVCLIEWPEKAQGWLPTADLHIFIEIDNQSRALSFEAHTERGKNVLQMLHG